MIKDARKGERVYITFSHWNSQVHRWVEVLDVVEGGYIVGLDGNKAYIVYENVLQRPMREEEKPKPPPPPKKPTREEKINALLKGIRVLSEEEVKAFTEGEIPKEVKTEVKHTEEENIDKIERKKSWLKENESR
jgi:hypothetical protein